MSLKEIKMERKYYLVGSFMAKHGKVIKVYREIKTE